MQYYGSYRRLVPRRYTAPIDRGFCHQLHSDAISVCTNSAKSLVNYYSNTDCICSKNVGLSTETVGVAVFLFGRILTVLKRKYYIGGSQTVSAGVPRNEISEFQNNTNFF
jgi:hypothetical protein